MRKLAVLILALAFAHPAFACDKGKAMDLWLAGQSMRIWLISGGNEIYARNALLACQEIAAKPQSYYSGLDRCVDDDNKTLNSKEIVDRCDYFISLGHRHYQL